MFGDIEAGPELPETVVDSRVSAHRIRRFGARSGVDIFANEAHELCFVQLEDSAAASRPLVVLRYGSEILDLRTGRSRLPWDQIKLAGESPMSEQGDEARRGLSNEDEPALATEGEGERTLTVIDPAAHTRDLAQSFASGLNTTAERRASYVSIDVPGHDICIGRRLSLEDTQIWSLGELVVTGVTHLLNSRHGFITRIEAREV